MLQSVGESLDFLLTLPNLAVQLISIPLLLLSFLSSLDHIVGLRPLLIAFSIAFLLLLQAFELDSEVLYLALSFLKLYSHQVSLFLCCFELRDKDVLMHLDLLLPLLHAHLQLVLHVLKPKHFVYSSIDCLPQFLDLELHDVVLDKSFFLSLLYFLQITYAHLVLKLELLDLGFKVVHVHIDFSHKSFQGGDFIDELFVALAQR